jgi:hypothetical protein
MNNQQLYSVFFDGKIRDGEELAQVKNRMSALFKVDLSVVEKVFRDAPSAIQQNLPREKALKYKTAFEQTGALCRVEAVKPAAPPPSRPEMPATTMYKPEPATPPVEIETPLKGSGKMSGTGLYHLDKAAWTSMGIGAAITAVILFFPFLSFVFRYVNTLVHEIGHAIFGWLYGYPSVPAFDFNYGGGVTMHQDRKIFIVIIVYVLFALLLYVYRRNGLSLVVLMVIVGLYSVSTFTSLHSLVILFMGHGAELIFGSIFFYRALSGSSVIVAAERPLYAFLGFFIYFVDIRFAHRLMTSSEFRAQYEAAKGGGHWMDFSRIAEEFMHVKLSAVASFFLLLCLLTPFLTFLFFRYKEYLFDLFYRVLTPDPGA